MIDVSGLERILRRVVSWIDNCDDIQSTDSMIDVSGLERILRRKWCCGLTTVMISSQQIV